MGNRAAGPAQDIATGGALRLAACTGTVTGLPEQHVHFTEPSSRRSNEAAADSAA